jgi:essential nuclear protein 1
MPKATNPARTAAAARRHNPLADDIVSSGHLRTKSSKRKLKSGEDDDEDGNHYIDAKASRKILQIGQDLAEEEAAERRAALGDRAEKINPAFDFSSRFESGEQLSEDEDKFAEDQWGDEEVEEAVWDFPVAGALSATYLWIAIIPYSTH